MKNAIFTICSLNYLHKVFALHKSLQKYAEGFDVFHVFCDPPEDVDKYRHLMLDSVKVLKLSEIDFLGHDWKKLAFQYEVTEFNTAIKPFTFSHLFAQGYEQVIYIDPDIEFYSSIQPLANLLDEYDAIVTPHITQPLPEDDHFPLNIDILRAGQFNLGFVALRAHPEVAAFIEYWQRNCLKYCVFPYEGIRIFVDQFLADLIPSVIGNTKILRSHAYNMAYWNLAQRKLWVENDQYQTQDGPLVFFHFSGILENNITKVSKHTTRLTAAPDSPLYIILKDYIDTTNQFKQSLNNPTKYAFNYFADGEQILFADRRKYLFMSDVEKTILGDPFTAKTKIRQIQAIVGTRRDIQNILNNYQDVLKEYDHLRLIESSISWRVGRAVTFPLRAVRFIYRKFCNRKASAV